MSRKKAILLGACALILAIVPAALAVVAIQAAPDANDFAVPWWTVDGGGKTSQGGPYALSGSAGQPDAGGATRGSDNQHSRFWGITLQRIIHYLTVIVK